MANIFIEIIRLLQKLFSFNRSRNPIPPAPIDAAAPGDRKWLKLAKAEIGTKEIPGTEDNIEVLNYFRDSGFPDIDNDETAWCAAFVGAMLERSGHPGSKSLAARSYLQWGKEVRRPRIGDVVVFSRGNPRGWQGHVGFYMGETNGYILTLGGNQKNKVGIDKYHKSRLLGYRKPVSAFNSRTNKAGLVGAASTAGTTGLLAAFSLSEALDISKTLHSMGDLWWLIFVGLGISVFSHFWSIHARNDDLKNKGR